MTHLNVILLKVVILDFTRSLARIQPAAASRRILVRRWFLLIMILRRVAGRSFLLFYSRMTMVLLG